MWLPLVRFCDFWRGATGGRFRGLGELFLGVLRQLLGTGEKPLEFVFAAVKIAVVGGIASADARTIQINSTAIVGPKVLATVGQPDVPLPFLDENRHVLVTQIPADVVVFAARRRIVDGQGKIPATQGGALRTKRLGHKTTFDSGFYFRTQVAGGGAGSAEPQQSLIFCSAQVNSAGA